MPPFPEGDFSTAILLSKASFPLGCVEIGFKVGGRRFGFIQFTNYLYRAGVSPVVL